MRQICKTYKANSNLFVFGLVLLLLFSPCKVRNFLQAELGVPQTKVLVKNQTTIAQSDCYTFETPETAQNFSKPIFQESSLLISDDSCFDLTSYTLKHSFGQNKTSIVEAIDVPLYILYQNIQIYS